MNLLEHWYVSRFRPVAGGYLFEQWGCDVHFSEAEVTELRAEWRRIWLSPWLWGGWLALGVAVPALLYARGAVAGAARKVGEAGGVVGAMAVAANIPEARVTGTGLQMLLGLIPISGASLRSGSESHIAVTDFLLGADDTGAMLFSKGDISLAGIDVVLTDGTAAISGLRGEVAGAAWACWGVLGRQPLWFRASGSQTFGRRGGGAGATVAENECCEC